MGNEDTKIGRYQWSNLKNQYLAAFVGSEKIREKINVVHLFIIVQTKHIYFSQHNIFWAWVYE